MRTAIILAILGILLSTAIFSKNEETIVLTPSNHIYFYGPVGPDTVNLAQLEFAELHNKLPTPEIIFLVLNTPGGSLVAGGTLTDYIKSTGRHVKVICISCSSMGYNFFQSFGERLVLPSSSLMAHPATLTLSGEYPEQFYSRLKEFHDMIERFDIMNAKRLKMTKKAYQKLVHDELNMTGEQAVKLGHADRIANITCAPVLTAAVKLAVQDKNILTLSACPLLPNPLSSVPIKE